VRAAEPGPRRPGAVPDEPVDVRAGHDTDRDGRPDTVLDVDGPDLLVHTDLDGDGLADQVLRIGPDGEVRSEPDVGVLDGLWGGAAAGSPD
jgi:hypothetical protein